MLVVRTPNVSFYEQWHARLRRGLGNALRGLAYNNLLGFPYQYGYSRSALIRLLRRFGFYSITGYNSSLLTMPFPDPRLQVQMEATMVDRAFTRMGPWIEIVCRRKEI